MKIELIREKLIESLVKADRVTSKNPTLAILSCVLIGAADDQVVIKATNLEIGMEITIPAKVSNQGVVAIVAGPLISFLNSLPEEKNVLMELDSNKNINIHCGEHRAVLKTVPYEDFPIISNNNENGFEIDVKSISQGFQSVWYSSAVSGIKPELSSVYVYSDDEKADLVFVATDSFRLAEKRVRPKKPISGISILVPFKNIPDLLKTIENEDIVTVCINDHQISFSGNNIFVTSRLVNGSFPDYKRIIPGEFSTEVTLLKEDFAQGLKMMRVFSDKFNQISMKVFPNKNHCEIISKNSDIGEGEYVFKSKIKGESVNLNFNHKYLSDPLASIQGESLVIQLNGAGKAAILKSSNDPSFTYLVMPNK